MYDPSIHRRRSIRLRHYDYSQNGLYFITICCHQRACLFGEIRDGVMILNPFGQIAHDEWLKSAEIRAEVELDELVVMPNHFHAIVGICRGDRPDAPAIAATGNVQGPKGPSPKSLGSLVGGYKSAVTSAINGLRGQKGSPVWQRNYHEHVIRDEASYLKIAEYVQTNPLRWEDDIYHA